MKQLHFKMAALAVALSSIVSCQESKFEEHETTFIPIQTAGMVLFADQTNDSIHLRSLDPWTAHTEKDWLTISPSSSKTLTLFARLDLHFGINNSGYSRTNRIYVDGYDKISMPVIQFYHLNIQKPSRKSSTPTINDVTKEQFTFEGNIDYSNTDIQLCFTTYAPNATITCNEKDWITLPDTILSPGFHDFHVKCEKNESNLSRQALFHITSGGITTDVTITQSEKK